MRDLSSEHVRCPYCGERIELAVDCSVHRQEYIEDCSVCCRPIVVVATTVDGDVASLEVRTEDD